MEIFSHDIWGDEIRRKWGGGAGTHGFKGELMGHQSTPIYYKGGELKKITSQSTDNERGIIRI